MQRVSRLYRRATELTSQLKEMEIPQLDLPDSPVGLSYMVSYVLDLGAASQTGTAGKHLHGLSPSFAD